MHFIEQGLLMTRGMDQQDNINIISVFRENKMDKEYYRKYKEYKMP